MSKRPHFLRLFSPCPEAVTAFALIAICVGTIAAQSGRRLPRSGPAPIPTPLPVEKEPPEEAKPALSLVIGIDEDSDFTNVPLYFFDSVLGACADRLDDAPSIRVSLVHRGMDRSEAVNRAKAETEAYVVWMQLRTDFERHGRASDFSELYIEFWLFEPTTAKLKTSGRSYQQGHRSGSIVMAPRTSGRDGLPHIEYLLKQAAREAAERILKALDVNLPRDRLPQDL